jgi:hypothetical protein
MDTQHEHLHCSEFPNLNVNAVSLFDPRYAREIFGGDVNGDSTSSNPWVKVYEGLSSNFTVGRASGEKALEPDSVWEVRLTAVNQNGESEYTHSRWVSTLAVESDALPSGILPMPWTRCWVGTDTGNGDTNSVSTQFCYFYNENLQISQWHHPLGKSIESDRPNRPLAKKMAILLDTLRQRHNLGDPTKIVVNVARETILRDSAKSFQAFLNQGHRGKVKLYRPTNIRFKGEDGIDSGGLSRDWYVSVSAACLAPDLQLFHQGETSGLHSIVYHAIVDATDLSYFRFLGIFPN